MDDYRQGGSNVREYRLGDVLGIGGFSVTYEAYHAHLGKHFAIKEYFPASLAKRKPEGGVTARTEPSKQELFEKGLERFLKEARTLEAINHPNIVKVRDVFVEGGTGFMVMDFIDGETLEARVLRDGALSPRTVQPLIDRLCTGLKAVHASGFLHRDIKPSNIMLRSADNEPILIDFGSAKSLEVKTSATTQFVSHGYSPLEMSATRLESGPWSDIYSLSASAWFALKGKAPSDAIAERFSAENDPLEPLVNIGGPWVQFLSSLDHGLSLYPDKRPQSVAAWQESFDSGRTQIASVDDLVPGQRARDDQNEQMENELPSSPGEEGFDQDAKSRVGFFGHVSSRYVLWLTVLGIFSMMFASRLANPAAGYPVFYAFGVAGFMAASLGAALFLFDSLFETCRHKWGLKSKWFFGLHYLLAPVASVVIVAWLWFYNATNPVMITINQWSTDLRGGDPMTIALLIWLFLALGFARRISAFGTQVKSSMTAGIFTTMYICGFVTPFFQMDEQAAVERLAAIGYFPMSEEIFTPNQYNLPEIEKFNSEVIRSFQNDEGLEPTGTINAETWRSLLLHPVKWNWNIDPTQQDAALKIMLANRACKKDCVIQIGRGTIDISNVYNRFNQRFMAPNASSVEAGLVISSNAQNLEIRGAGPETVLANDAVQSNIGVTIADLTVQEGRLIAWGGTITNVEVNVRSDQAAVSVSSYLGRSLVLDRLRVTNSQGPAMRIENLLTEMPVDGHLTQIDISDSVFTGGSQNLAAVAMFIGYMNVQISGGEIRGFNSRTPSIHFSKATGDIDGTKGACLDADDKSKVSIRNSDLSKCGARRRAIEAKDGAEVDVESTNILPDRPDAERFLQDASSRITMQ